MNLILCVWIGALVALLYRRAPHAPVPALPPRPRLSPALTSEPQPRGAKPGKPKPKKEKKPLLALTGLNCRWCGLLVQEGGRLHPKGTPCATKRDLAFTRARFNNRPPPRTQAEADERELFQGNPRKSPHRRDPWKRRCKPGLRKVGDTGREPHGEVKAYVMAPVAGHILPGSGELARWRKDAWRAKILSAFPRG